MDTAVASVRSQARTARLNGTVADLSSAASADAVMAKLLAVDVPADNVDIFELKPFAEIYDADCSRPGSVGSQARQGQFLLRRVADGLVSRQC